MRSDEQLSPLGGIFGLLMAIFRPIGYAVFVLLFGRKRVVAVSTERQLVLTGGVVIGLLVGISIGIGDGSSVFTGAPSTEDVATWIAALILGPIGGLIVGNIIVALRRTRTHVS